MKNGGVTMPIPAFLSRHAGEVKEIHHTNLFQAQTFASIDNSKKSALFIIRRSAGGGTFLSTCLGDKKYFAALLPSTRVFHLSHLMDGVLPLD
jgi:hypothetical protein